MSDPREVVVKDPVGDDTGAHCAVTAKKVFRSPGAAQSMCRTIRRRSDERMKPYRCEHCRFWHIAHVADGTDRKAR